MLFNGKPIEQVLAFPKQLIHFIHRLDLHCRQHMRIGIHRHTDRAVPKNFLHDLGMDTHTEYQ
jgi:hypothetical protein